MTILTRRKLVGFGAAAGGLILSGCDALADNAKLKKVVQSAEGATQLLSSAGSVGAMPSSS